MMRKIFVAELLGKNWMGLLTPGCYSSILEASKKEVNMTQKRYIGELSFAKQLE